LTAAATNRYPSPTRFIEILSLALVPLLWRKNEKSATEDSCHRTLSGLHGEDGMMRNLSSTKDVVDNYCCWNLSVFHIEKERRILDLGCGPALYLDAILAYNPTFYLATDYSKNFLDMARKRMNGLPNCRTEILDIVNPTCATAFLAEQKMDYVLCFDVLEHLADDVRALNNISEIMLATSACTLFVRVPALPFIYGSNDRAIGHYRRYTRNSLRAALATAGFHVRRIGYHNIAGVLPWFIIGRLCQRSLAVSAGEGRFFDRIVPMLRWFESLVPPPIGLSLYCEATQTMPPINRIQHASDPGKCT
jgi:SAM-dependent methyltransferase